MRYKYKVDQTIIDKASPTDIEFLIKRKILKKLRSGYYLVCYSFVRDKFSFIIEYARGKEFLAQLDAIDEPQFSLYIWLVPVDGPVYIILGKYEELAYYLENIAEDYKLWRHDWNSTIIKVHSKEKAKNLLVALTGNGTYLKTVDIKKFIDEFAYVAATLKRVFGKQIKFNK